MRIKTDDNLRVEDRNTAGLSSLHIAARAGQVNTVSLLLQNTHQVVIKAMVVMMMMMFMWTMSMTILTMIFRWTTAQDLLEGLPCT